MKYLNEVERVGCLESLENFRRHGDRTSSLISLYDHFTSFASTQIEGELRYIEKRGVIGIANEPLVAPDQKEQIIRNFISHKGTHKKDILIFPITQFLARQLQQQGMHLWHIGVEPIFQLSEYFTPTSDPLHYLPIARALKKRGALVKELNKLDLTQHRDEIEDMRHEWLAEKTMGPLEFLNTVIPFTHEEYKRFFALYDRGVLVAVLTATPIYSNEQIIAYFFNDILKYKVARSGTAELLIVESMRLLHQIGVAEIRLGLCPLAEIPPHERDAQELTKIFEGWRWGYQFKNLYNFKTKLRPTSMRPLYIASTRPELYRLLKNIIRLHTTGALWWTIGLNLIQRFWYKNRSSLKLKEHVRPHTLQSLASKRSFQLLWRIKGTLLLATIFIGLHALKNNSELVRELFSASAYRLSEVTLLGVFAGPFFHNHSLHLAGDQISFILLGAVLEYTFGAKLLLFVTALGLWLSNPVTHLGLITFLKPISPFWWDAVLHEHDYGSSNAVFALVGAATYVLKKYLWMLIPFSINALYVCLQKESFLSIHHFTGIALGVMGAYLYFNFWINRQNGS